RRDGGYLFGQALDERNGERCGKPGCVAYGARVEFRLGSDFGDGCRGICGYQACTDGSLGQGTFETRHRGEQSIVGQQLGASIIPEGMLKRRHRDGYALPQTSSAVSITRRSFVRWASTAMLLPWTVLENPHCGLSASWSRGAYFAASSMRRLRSSFFSSASSLVVTRPSTTTLPLDR